ncbi:MAG: hypothetical protein LBO66_15275 [Deltaproteobacteria bacterium]|jgi:hypothetical protein|nr:hypothetical protein [Deltaproteobacteria bacterium]
MRVPPLPDLNARAVKLVPLAARASKVTFRDFGRPLSPGAGFKDFADSLPRFLAASDLQEAARAIARARAGGRLVALAMGGHPIKVGLGPLIIDLMEKEIITSLSVNGSVMVHDAEVAMAGQTSEDVSQAIGEGAFGVTGETGALINRAAQDALARGRGLGESLGDALLAGSFPHARQSVVAQARRLGVPLTVHLTLGADVYHIHPEADGQALGAASFRDFHLFARLVAALEGGVFLNLGSAVVMPEVFLKALSLTRNLGFSQKGMTTVNMDFARQYRPRVNVVERPTQDSGKGYELIGHHEIMFPLLTLLAQERLRDGDF